MICLRTLKNMGTKGLRCVWRRRLYSTSFIYKASNENCFSALYSNPGPGPQQATITRTNAPLTGKILQQDQAGDQEQRRGEERGEEVWGLHVFRRSKWKILWVGGVTLGLPRTTWWATHAPRCWQDWETGTAGAVMGRFCCRHALTSTASACVSTFGCMIS